MGRRRQGTPVGLGYMPKGGRAAAVAHNEAWRADHSTAASEAPVGAPDRSGVGVGESESGARSRAGEGDLTASLARIGALSGVSSLVGLLAVVVYR